MADVVIEMVSNQKGEEAERTLRDYARIRVDYSVIFDPAGHVGAEPLRIYLRQAGAYRQADDGLFTTGCIGYHLATFLKRQDIGCEV